MRGKAYTGNKRIRNRHSSKAIRVLGRVSAVVLLSVSPFAFKCRNLSGREYRDRE